MEHEFLQWHPAFSAVLRIEFAEDLEILDIIEEYMLGKKPMQMDVLIIKKEPNIPVKKNIGRIFRKHNVIEYKSPDDYLSINDFYKVYGYTCFYQSDTEKVCEISPEELTITFVCNHYPYKMLKHLKKARNIQVKKQEPGIYYLTGDAFPMQLLIPEQMSKEENFWLQSLRANLETDEEIKDLMEHYQKKKYSKWHRDAMNMIVRANHEKVKEEDKMCEALWEIFGEKLMAQAEEKAKELAEEKVKEFTAERAKRLTKLYGISPEEAYRILA